VCKSLWEIAVLQKGGAIVWALNNSFRYLCEHGIEPHAQIMIDARIENLAFVPDETDALLLYSTQCHPHVLDKAMTAGKLILWCPSIEKILEILNEYKKLAAVVAGGFAGLLSIFTARETSSIGVGSPSQLYSACFCPVAEARVIASMRRWRVTAAAKPGLAGLPSRMLSASFT